MSNPKIILSSWDDSNKTVSISTEGNRQAQIIIPIESPNLDLVNDSEFRAELINKILPDSFLPKPVLQAPIDGTQNYKGDFILQDYNSPVEIQNPTCVTEYEISTTNNFTNTVFLKQYKSNRISNLPYSDLLDTGLEDNVIYYVRVRLFINNYSTTYSDVVSFTIKKSNFLKPTINRFELVKNIMYTGEVQVDITPEVTDSGTPGSPNIIEFYVTNIKDNVEHKFEFEKDLYSFKLKWVPFVLFPNNQYRIRFAYYNSNLDIRSPLSDYVDISIPKTTIKAKNLKVVQTSSSIANNPTMGVENLLVDYDLLDNLDNLDRAIIPQEELTSFKGDIKDSRFEYKFIVSNTDGELATELINKDSDSVFNTYYKGCLFSLNKYTLGLNNRYSLNFDIKWYDKNSTILNHVIHSPETISFLTSNYYNTAPLDDLLTPNKELDGFGYYGEITERTLLPEDIIFKGKLTIGVTYNKNNEVIHNDELYLCKNNNVRLDSLDDLSSFVKITKDNIKEHYYNGLPTGNWLVKQLGIPTHLDTIPGVVNNKEGWVKCHNLSNQTIYIAKKPFITNIDYETLNNRYLCGHGSRTLRIGLNYYNVRMLEYSPTKSIDPKYTYIGDTNKQDEIELFKKLFTTLHEYNPEDLGFTDNCVMYTNKGYIDVDTDDGLSFIDREYITPLTSDIKMYRPVLELIQEGYEPYRGTTVSYDKYTDTGYYGIVPKSELLSPIEFIREVGLTGVDNINNNISYHKFYYRGLTIYIPTQPICSNITFKELMDKDLIDGKKSITINNRVFRLDLVNLTKPYEINEDYLEDYVSDKYEESIYNLLLARVFTNLNNIYNLDMWSNSTLDNKELVFLRDRTDVNNLCMGDDIIKREYDNGGYYLPVFITETLDLNKDLTYPTPGVREPTITKQTVEVTRYRTELQEVEKIRVVEKSKTIQVSETVTNIVKVPTGKYLFKNREYSASDKYGVILYYTLKENSAYIKDYLYKRKELNLIKQQNKTYINFSDSYRSLKEFICKSVMAPYKTDLLLKPMHIYKLFKNSSDLKDYIYSLVSSDIKVVNLTNYLYDKILNSKDSSLPLGLLYGNISSKVMYYPVNRYFNLQSDTLDDGFDINYSPGISVLDGRYLNSVTKVNTSQEDNIELPILNSLIPYEDYGPIGKGLMDNLIFYIKQLTGYETSFIKDNFVFGVVGVELETLRYLEGNGFIAGDSSNPVIGNFAATSTIPEYIGTGKYSNGKDFLDIDNPVEETVDKEVTQTVTKDKIVYYEEIEKYTVSEYVSVPYTEQVEIEVITYN